MQNIWRNIAGRLGAGGRSYCSMPRRRMYGIPKRESDPVAYFLEGVAVSGITVSVTAILSSAFFYAIYYGGCRTDGLSFAEIRRDFKRNCRESEAKVLAAREADKKKAELLARASKDCDDA